MPGRWGAAYQHTTTTPLFVRHLTSPFLPPLPLALLRLLISIYIFATLVTTALIQVSLGHRASARSTFAFFTHLGYYGLGFYFLVTASHGIIYSVRGRKGLAAGENEGPVAGWRGVLRFMHGAFYATIVTYPLVVTIVFWSLLSHGQLYDRFSTWNNISEHALNTVFAVLEMLLTRTAAPAWIFLVPAVIILAAYLGLTFIVHATMNFYVYPFLDPTKTAKGFIAAYVVGILVGYCIVFAIIGGVILMRIWITEEDQGMRGKFSKHDTISQGEVAAGDVETVTVVRQVAPKQAPARPVR